MWKIRIVQRSEILNIKQDPIRQEQWGWAQWSRKRRQFVQRPFGRAYPLVGYKMAGSGIWKVFPLPLGLCKSYFLFPTSLASQLVPLVMNPHANAGNTRGTGLIPGLGRSPEEEMETYSSVLAWRIPWIEEPVGYSPWGCRVRDN